MFESLSSCFACSRTFWEHGFVSGNFEHSYSDCQSEHCDFWTLLYESRTCFLFSVAIATVFGTLILTNLLIALMTTKYDDVRERAAAEVMCNQAELAYDLTTQTSRLMPAPVNIIVCRFSYYYWWAWSTLIRSGWMLEMNSRWWWLQWCIYVIWLSVWYLERSLTFMRICITGMLPLFFEFEK